MRLLKRFVRFLVKLFENDPEQLYCCSGFLRPDSLRFSYSSAIYVETAMYSCYIECENRDGSGEIYEKDSNAVCRDFGCRGPVLQLWKCNFRRADNGENRLVQES